MRNASGCVLILLIAAVIGCSDDSNGTGGSGGVAGTGGAAGAGGASGAGGEGGTGGNARACRESGTVEFVHATDSGRSSQDCITPDVCLTRGIVRGLFNAAMSSMEMAPNRNTSPIGTLWARSTCAVATEFDFEGFTGMTDRAPSDIVDEGVCLWLTDSNLKYDVVFSDWEQGGGGGFTYQRTATTPDECGAPNAICFDDDTCRCPTGLVVDPESGVCALPDPCDPDPCGTDALCRRFGRADHVCECDTVEFARPAGDSDLCDQIGDRVCIARATQRGIYNSVEETQYGGQQCSGDIVSPTSTVWSDVPCAESVEEDFGTWSSDSFAGCEAQDTLAQFGCIRLTGDGEEWDVFITGWCRGESSLNGCFSYIRSHFVDDGVACAP